MERNTKIALIVGCAAVIVASAIGIGIALTRNTTETTTFPQCTTKEPVSDLENKLIGKTISNAINIIETEGLGIDPSKIFPINETSMFRADYVMGRIRLFYCDTQENLSNDLRIVTKIRLN